MERERIWSCSDTVLRRFAFSSYCGVNGVSAEDMVAQIERVNLH